MAYSNVATPKFYIDNYLYNKAIGADHWVLDIFASDGDIYGVENPRYHPDLYDLKPNIASELNLGSSNLKFMSIPCNTTSGSIADYDFTGNMKWYYAVLNHNLNDQYIAAGAASSISLDPDTGQYSTTFSNIPFDDPVLNGDYGNESVGLNGSSIFTLSAMPYYPTNRHIILRFQDEGDEPVRIGGVSAGIQYSMPHSPDLELIMSYEMDGISNISTSEGGTISNLKYTGNPLWYNGNNITNPFDVYPEGGCNVKNFGGVRNGRKTWEMTFSYISDYDLFSSNNKGTTYTEHPNDSTYNDEDLSPEGGASTGSLAYTLFEDDSFYAQVWNKTLGGALPFMFQPDGRNNDDIYICKFDQESLRIHQKAHRAYTLTVRIMETW